MTVPILGQALLLLAFVAAVTGCAAAALGGRRIRLIDPDRVASNLRGASPTGDRAGDLGIRALHVLLVTCAGAIGLVLLALTAKDYTLAYVQGHTSNDLTLGFRLTALWSGQQGSLLLWLTVLCAFGSLMVRSLRRAGAPAALLSYANAVVLGVAAFFALLVAFVARPFAVVDQLARDGAGMSPSLQNYWMAIHPPTLYLGYVGVTIPFAIVMGALLARRRDDAWIGTTRGWALLAWTFLTLGLILGSRWAYEEIGWGGYWAWDPVENAALMPWLTTTALLHSVMVQQRRGMMRFWNAVLATLTFGLSIFGTFLTRSGVLSSVHAFVSSPVGWWFIGALIVVIAGSMLLLHRSRGLLHARHDVDAVVSREGMLLFNNLLLVALALVILWGVTYPILTAAFTDSRISLQKPWYDFFAAAFGLPLAFLLAFAPVVAWQGTPWRRVLRSMLVPVVATVALGVALVAAGLGSSASGVAAVCLGALVVFGVVSDLLRAIRLRAIAAPEQSTGARVVHVLVRNRRRWGAWTAHAGIALVVIAVAGTAWTTTVTRQVRTGDTIEIGSYALTYRTVERERVGAAMRTRAVFAVTHDGRREADIAAGRDFHPASGEVSNEVGIRHDYRRLQDLFVTVDRLTEDGSATVKVLVNPLVPLLWLAGAVLALGALLAGLPTRADTNSRSGVGTDGDALHELRNGAAAPGELLSGVRGSSGGAGS